MLSARRTLLDASRCLMWGLCMRKDWLQALTPPLFIEGRHDETEDWAIIHEMQNLDDFEFALSSYDLQVYPLMRLRDAQGKYYAVSQSELLKHNEKAVAKIEAKTEPLTAFANAAPEQSMETAAELIRGGLASRHFTIPARAQVRLHHANLHHIRLMEFEKSVVCRVHIDDSEPDDSEPTVTIWKEAPSDAEADICFSVAPRELADNLKAFLCLLCASIVRDFWILENRTRQRTYQTRTEKTRRREGRGQERRLVVEKDYIFLPRVQYDLTAYQDRAREITRDVRVTLSPHLVSGHIRRLPEGWNRSEEAEAAAAEFGIKLDDGQTFVRPHERGEVEQLRSYRSRSAFELIFGN